MNPIVNKVIETIQEQAHQFENDPDIKELEIANSEFKNLLKAGVVKERGYNLLTVESAHLIAMRFNVTSE